MENLFNCIWPVVLLRHDGGILLEKYGSQNHRIGTRYPIFRMPGQHTKNSSSLVEIFSQERLVHIKFFVWTGCMYFGLRRFVSLIMDYG